MYLNKKQRFTFKTIFVSIFFVLKYVKPQFPRSRRVARVSSASRINFKARSDILESGFVEF